MITAHTTSCLQVTVATQTTARIHLPDTMDQVCLLLAQSQSSIWEKHITNQALSLMPPELELDDACITHKNKL